MDAGTFVRMSKKMFYKLPILKVYAGRVLKDKIKSLQNDVRKCLSESKKEELQPATFTALLTCFSTLDFLSALYAGDAGANASTTAQVTSFIHSYFGYSSKKTDLLLKIYRHKLVHLFQPGHIVEYKNVTYSWTIYDKNKKKHLVTSKVNKLINPAPSVRLKIDYIFSISIITFMEEICSAANGYFKDLIKKENSRLQRNFDKAINDIFSITN